MIVSAEAFARAGLIGNPSDGYFGKTIAFTFRNFFSRVTLFESPELRIEPHYSDRMVFSSIDELLEDVKLTGYYGGVRLIKAGIIRFARYLQEAGLPPLEQTFTVRYETNIPQRVGLAGSSAIITALFRALSEFVGIEIPWATQANLVLETETCELGIPAGLQDRVVQAYEGVVYMDFARQYMREYGYGRYEQLSDLVLDSLYVAYSDSLGEGTEVPHSNLRERFERGDRTVRHAMKEFARLTDLFRHAMEQNDRKRMNALINRNFDLRASLVPISRENWQLINTARNLGASAKFAGSGGAIVGFYEGPEMFEAMARAFKQVNARVLRPDVLPPRPLPVSPESEDTEKSEEKV